MSEEPEKLAEGTLISHLLELRDRLIRALIVVGDRVHPVRLFRERDLRRSSRSRCGKLPKGSQLVATSVISPFMAPFKLSFFVALFIAIPYVLYQIWAFVAPGLYKHEKRFAMPLVLSSILLFYVGVAFAYTFVFPVMFEFFAATAPKGVKMMTDIRSYLDFVLTMFLAFGVAFEVPIAVVLLVITGIVSLEKLQDRARLRAHRHLRDRRVPHAAGCGLPVHHGRADVPAVRGRHDHGARADAHAARSAGTRRSDERRPTSRSGRRPVCRTGGFIRILRLRRAARPCSCRSIVRLRRHHAHEDRHP